MKTVIDIGLQGSAFILLLITLRPWMKKAVSARFRNALWIIPALRLLIPFSPASPLSLWRFGRFQHMRTVPGSASVPLPAVAGKEMVNKVVVQPLVNSKMTVAEALPDMPPIAFCWQANIFNILMMVWIIGILLALTCLFISNYRFHQVTQPRTRLKGLGAPLPVFLSNNLSSPCLIGVLKPRILLNKASIRSKEIMDMVLCHELTHWQRHDHLWTLLRAVVMCVWWWNPIVWVAVKLSRVDCEAACDETITQGMNRTERESYGMSLIELMREKQDTALPMHVGTAMKSGKKQMEERIKLITSYIKKSTLVSISFAVVLALLLPLMFTVPRATSIAEAADKRDTNTLAYGNTTKASSADALSITGVIPQETLFSDCLKSLAQFIQKNGENINQWPVNDQKQLCNLVKKLPNEQLQQDTTPDIVLARYAFEGKISLNSMIEAIYQSFDDAPYTIKALYSRLRKEYFHDPEEHFLLPGENDMQEKDAVAASKRFLKAVSIISNETLDTAAVRSSFLTDAEYGERVWFIQLIMPNSGFSYNVVVQGSTGAITKFSLPGRGWLIPGELTGEGIPMGAQCAQPSVYDAKESLIIQLSQKFCQQTYGKGPWDVSAYFIYHETFNLGCEPVWFSVCRNGNRMYRCLFAYNGSFIDSAEAGKAFTVTWRREPSPGDIEWPNGLIDSNGRMFSSWTVEEKAEFSRYWKPIIDQYLTVNPYYQNWNKSIYRATRFIYSLPERGEIPRKSARSIAGKELVRLGAPESSAMSRTAYEYFDRTNGANPQWRFVFPSANDDRSRYKVTIQAATGKIVDSFKVITQEFSDIDF